MKTNMNLNIKEFNSYGKEGKKGNLLGIEPYVLPEDYASIENLQAKLDGYLSVAQSKGWINERTVVLWPEYIGTWLVFTGEKPDPTLPGIINNLVAAHQKEYSAFLASAPEQKKDYAAIFRTKAQDIAVSYQTIFSRLAKKYKVTTIAGSLVLPSPSIANGKMVLDVNGPLYNVGMVLDAKGKPYPQLVYKAYPTSGELVFTTPAPVGVLPAFDTPAGRIGVLICADSFYPQAYARLKTLKVDAIAVPSYGHGGLKAWTATWIGNDGWPNSPDVNPKDVNKITNSKAWRKYSLVGRISETQAAHGINVFLHGELWPELDMGGGVSVVVRNKHNDERWNREFMTSQATLNNLWF
ncbi:MAG: nitrilase-related carbon-nitrogen hydrolase [Chloroflexota bacterium]